MKKALGILIFLTLLSPFVDAANVLFLPGDCVFISRLSPSEWRKQLAKEVIVVPFAPRSMLSCGYFGFASLTIDSMSADARRFILNTLELPEFGPKPSDKKFPKDDLDPFNPLPTKRIDRRVFMFYPLDFDIKKHRLFSRYNRLAHKEVEKFADMNKVEQRAAVEMYANAAEEGAFNFPAGSPATLGVKQIADGKTIVLPAEYQIIAFHDYLWPVPISEGALIRVFRLGRISEYKYDGKQWRQTKIVFKVGSN